MIVTAVLAPGDAPSNAANEPSAGSHYFRTELQATALFAAFDDLHPLARHRQTPVVLPRCRQKIPQRIKALCLGSDAAD